MMDKFRRLGYEAIGAQIGKAVRGVRVPTRHLVGGLGVATKMFAIMADLESKDIITKDKSKEQLLRESGHFDKSVKEVSVLSKRIIENCADTFEGVSMNLIIAALAESAVEMAMLRDEESGEAIVDLEAIKKDLKEMYGDKLSNTDHECHADCPAVGVCPQGIAKFPNGADKETAATKPENSVEDEFEKLRATIQSGDAIATMDMVTKMLVKKTDK
jgi:hypothetical protein